MKISIAELKQLIKESLSQINYPPGRYEPSTGEPLEQDELDQLYYGGFPDGIEEEDLPEEVVEQIVAEGIMLQNLNVFEQFELDHESVIQCIFEAKYKGREVKLGKPMGGDVKKYKVYVKDPKTGNVKKVEFGDPNMEIRRDNPKARKSFRARHGCGTPRASDRTKAAYWACRLWSTKPVSKILRGK
jgi:hypothetical protein